MKILVTGATGNIGKRLAPYLLKQNESVRILVRNPESAKAFEGKDLEIAIGDISQPETLPKALEGIDVVIHLAAFFRSKDEEQIKQINIGGTKILAEAAVKANVKRFVFASTSLVYGRGDRLCAEDTPTQAATLYPQTKVASEEMLLELSKKNLLDVRILRFAFVYGEGDLHLVNILPILKTWLPMKRLQTVNHADIGQALLLVSKAEGINGNIYNIADDAPLTTAEIFRIHGKEFVELSDQNGQNSAAWEIIMDTAKIRRDLGYRPLVPSLYEAKVMGLL